MTRIPSCRLPGLVLLPLALLGARSGAQDDLESLEARAIESYAAGDYPAARAAAERALEAADSRLGADSPASARIAGNLAAICCAEGRLTDAERLLERAVAIHSRTTGSDRTDVAACLNNLAAVYAKQGRHREAEPLLERSLAIQEAAPAPDHAALAATLDNLAILKVDLGRHAEGERLLRRALETRKRSLGPNHPETSRCLGNLGVLFCRQGRYDEAEPLCRQALAELEATLGADHPATAGSRARLGELLMFQGRHASAEPLLHQAMTGLERSLGPAHPDTVEVATSLARLLYEQGQYDRAEAMFRAVLDIRVEALGPNHPHVATSCNNLAAVHAALDRFPEAERLYARSLTIVERSFGPDHPETATVLGNLANLLVGRGRLAEAEPLLQRALEIHDRVTGPDHPDTMMKATGLAELYRKQGRLDRAEALQRRSLASLEGALGAEHPAVFQCLNDMAILRAARGDWSGAAEFSDRARRGRRRYVASILPSLTAAEQRGFLATQDESALKGALAIGLLRRLDPAIASLSAGWLANGKAVAHEAAAQRLILARQAADPATAAAAAALARVRRELAGIANAPPVPGGSEAHRRRVDALQQDERRLVHEIGGLLSMLSQDAPWVEIDAIRAGLRADSVLVDIARFEVFDFESPDAASDWRPARYAAWVVPPADGRDVTIVDLGPADGIDSLVAAYRQSILAGRADPAPGESLAARILHPLLEAIGDAREVVLCPDGALWLVPWQALPLPDGRFAIERHSISTLISSRDLLRKPFPADARRPRSPPLVIADPAYDGTPPDGPERPAGPDPAPHPLFGRIEPLPGTRREASAARGPLEALCGIEPVVRMGHDATEAALTREAAHPPVVVLATHGFFLPDPRAGLADSPPPMGARGISGVRPLGAAGRPLEDPLLRCGLLLAGANRSPPERRLAEDDGVLTGAEIVGLDLRGTSLVVLSACDTGVGDVRHGEGVAGLRQAFQIAGAESVIATLWPVPDEESGEIMAAFYRDLGDGEPPSRALRGAQLAFVQSRRATRGRDAAHPLLWAAFVVTGP